MPNLRDVKNKAEAYFQACDETRKEVILKNGELRYYQVPYTMAGLCGALGISREEFCARCREKGQEAALLRGYGAKIEQYTVERALLGELSNSVAALLLKSWGYGDPTDSGEAAPAALTVTLEDKEDWSQ